MSASLVGSEMCIRDSTSTEVHLGQLGRLKRRTIKQQDDETVEERTPRPVSYTHLTLPTICSV
eukprot:13494441-Alexandrium_andersonii.AAC.1